DRLHGKQETGLGAARRVLNMRKILVRERGELVENGGEQRTVRIFQLFQILVELPDRELNVLQDHAPQRNHGISVAIRIEADEQNQIILDNFFHTEEIVI